MSDLDLWTGADFQRHTHVPRGTFEAFEAWETLLRKWNSRINLVASREVDQFWRRHAFDSWQLNAYLPKTWGVLVDLGSGGGFPGLSLGIHAKETGAGKIYLVESIGKKTSFLKSVSRELALPVTVHTSRIEALPPFEADIITARAFAPLPRLFAYAAPHLAENGILILPKGETADKEIKDASQGWNFDVEHFKSKTDPQAKILRVSNLRAK